MASGHVVVRDRESMVTGDSVAAGSVKPGLLKLREGNVGTQPCLHLYSLYLFLLEPHLMGGAAHTQHKVLLFS